MNLNIKIKQEIYSKRILLLLNIHVNLSILRHINHYQNNIINHNYLQIKVMIKIPYGAKSACTFLMIYMSYEQSDTFCAEIPKNIKQNAKPMHST